MELLRGSIDGFHGLLAESAKACLTYDVEAAASGSISQWWRVTRDTVVDFHIQAADRGVRPASAQRHRGNACPVFPLLLRQQFDPTVWVAWCDEWRALGSERFRFVSASWTFFWGTPYTTDMLQLCRAEWDALLRQKAVPQPHWHFDEKLTALVTLAEPLVDAGYGALEELPAGLVELGGPRPTPRVEGIDGLDLSGLHLGMGWRNTLRHPDCWHAEADGAKMLREWAISTLHHAMDQFVDVRSTLTA